MMSKINLKTAAVFFLMFFLVLTSISYSAGREEYLIEQLHALKGVNNAQPKPMAMTKAGTGKRGECGTSIISEIRKEYNNLSPEGQAEVKKYIFMDQPYSLKKSSAKITADAKTIYNKFGLSNTYTTTNFVILWGDEPYNENNGTGIPPTDENANDVPDLVEQWGEYFEASWAKQVEGLGLKQPLKTSTYLMDIYIANTAGSTYADYLQLEGGYFAYTDTYSNNMAYIVVNNNMPYSCNDDPDGFQIGAMKVTAAHEFSHAVQFAYDRNEDGWWQEASAVWMEDEVYSYVNDYYNYINGDCDSGLGWTSEPEIYLTFFGNSSVHQYGDVVWAKYLSINYSGDNMFKDVWELCSTKTAINAVDAYLKNNGSNLKSAFKNFSVKNLDFTTNYAPDGENWNTVALTSTADFESVSSYKKSVSSSSSTPHPPSYLGANYIRFVNGIGTTLKITFNGPTNYQGSKVVWGVKVLKIKSAGGSEVATIKLNSSNDGTIKIPSFGSTYDDVYLAISVLNKGKKNYKNGVPYSVKANLVN
ncbi:MAG: hypothetical protein HZA77_14070 [Candidatus Schekmanbacteria bacterium]|nr:hypothetical protein [Candidatus Schekmanbacteria bacterium]